MAFDEQKQERKKYAFYCEQISEKEKKCDLFFDEKKTILGMSQKKNELSTFVNLFFYLVD